MDLPSITTQDAAEQLINSPVPAWIFKHSATCGISAMAHEALVEHLAGSAVPVGVVIVQTARPISNWLAVRLGYVHQSPQIFLVRGGKVLWQASHGSITAPALAKALAGAAGI